jgi:hypothetical protein
MRKAFLNLAVLGLTFLTGFSAHLVWSRGQLLSSGTLTVSAEQSRDEEWHRLYEAAGMTGDPQLISDVRDRLLCANRVGFPDAWPVDRDRRVWGRQGVVACQKRNGTIHELNESSEYGQFERRVMKAHAAWTLQHLAFVTSVVQPQTARAYVYGHEWPGAE